MADNDDYEIQYNKYLEKIGMTPPNLRANQTFQRYNTRGILKTQLFQNSSQKKELNYQRINSIIVLNDQLEINLNNRWKQSKNQNTTFNSEGKSPIMEIQTSLIQPNNRKSLLGLIKMDEFADEYGQEHSNKSNCFDSNNRQEQNKKENSSQDNLDLSSIQLQPIINECHEQIQAKSQSEILQQEIKETTQQLIHQEIQGQDQQNIHSDHEIESSKKEFQQQINSLIAPSDEKKQENFEQIEQQQTPGEIGNKVVDYLVQDNEQQQESFQYQKIELHHIQKSMNILVQEQTSNEIIYQQKTQIQESNVDINQKETIVDNNQKDPIVDNNQKEPSSIVLNDNQNLLEIIQVQIQEDNMINNTIMDIEQIEQSQISLEHQIIKHQQFIINQLQEGNVENQENQNNQFNQQQIIKQKISNALKKKQKKSRINNKKKKRAKKNNVESIIQQEINNSVKNQEQRIQNNDGLEQQSLLIDDKFPNKNTQKIEQEQKNPICSLLQQLIGGFCGEDIKIKWNKYTFLRRRISKKRNILLKSKLLI